jgi:hypothetical protein
MYSDCGSTVDPQTTIIIIVIIWLYSYIFFTDIIGFAVFDSHCSDFVQILFGLFALFVRLLRVYSTAILWLIFLA